LLTATFFAAGFFATDLPATADFFATGFLATALRAAAAGLATAGFFAAAPLAAGLTVFLVALLAFLAVFLAATVGVSFFHSLVTGKRAVIPCPDTCSNRSGKRPLKFRGACV